jgi:hypothetical protein
MSLRRRLRGGCGSAALPPAQPVGAGAFIRHLVGLGTADLHV